MNIDKTEDTSDLANRLFAPASVPLVVRTYIAVRVITFLQRDL